MIVLKLILFLGVAIVHSDPIHESDAKASPPLSLKWTSKFSMGLKLPDGREDEMTLRHADTAGGVAVPCLFEGTLENDANGHVAVLGCRDGDNTQVTLVSKYSNSTMFNVAGNNDTQEILDPYRVTNNEDEGLMETDEEQRDKRSTYPEDYDDYIEFSGASLDPVPQDLVYEIAVAYDETFLDKFGGNKVAAEQYIVAVMTHTQPYLLDGSLGTHIYLHIQHKPIFLQGKRLQVFDANLQSMEEAKRIASSVPLAIFTFSDDTDRYMGVAVRRQGCDPTMARIILKWRCDIQKIARTCSHEIAHLLGNFHDAREDVRKTLDGVTFPCEGKGLMSETVSIKERPATFSECSKKRLQVWYNTYGSCLTEGVACSADSNSWATPCLCGTRLCTEKHTCCEAATGTCLGFKNLDDVLAEMSWMKSQMMELSGLKSQMLELTTKTGNHDNLLSQQSTEMFEMKGEMKKLTTATGKHENLHTQQSIEMSGIKGEIQNHNNLLSQQSTKMSEMKNEIKKLTTKTGKHDNLHTQQSIEMSEMKGEILNHNNLLSQQSTEMSGMKGEIKNQNNLLSQQSSTMSGMKGQIRNHENLLYQKSTEISGIKNQVKMLTSAIYPQAQASVCSGYTTLTDLWRHIDYNNRGEFPYHCDKTGSSSSYTNLGWGSWYRFTGAAGTKLPTAPAPVGGGPTYWNQICGTAAVAYISSGGNPTIQDRIVTRDVCFEWQSDSCYGKTTVGVAACRDMHGDYFVYELQPAPVCNFAYCAID